MTHEIKLPPALFEPFTAAQRAIVLPTERKFALGDFLNLREHLPFANEFTDKALTFRIVSVINGEGVQPGHCVLSLEPVTNAPKPKSAPAVPHETKPAGFQIEGEVMEATPASITVQDRFGERHVLSGDAWNPAAKPTDSVLLTMTGKGWRVQVTNRPCPSNHLLSNVATDACAECGLPGHIVRALQAPQV